MMYQLATDIEKRAAGAQDLGAFTGVHLPSLRESVNQALQHIHSLGMFLEYTKHDAVHIDAMLETYDWMIPAETKEVMTPADWLLIVLSTYFHDFGMLVTQAEFDNRDRSDFPAFVDSIDNSTDENATDYRANLKGLTPHETERFLYQEFVREHHATRIRSWLSSHPDPRLGFDQRVCDLLRQLLTNLDPTFVDDIALVCESHHRNDLENTDKYPTDKPYGRTAAEAANVQYAAILLRAADLMDITRDRTPAVAFKVINPKNPKSLAEWERHQPVRTVRAKRIIPSEVDKTLTPPEQDTIEVHADFSDGRGFFGLTSYLQYAQKELRRCASWSRDSQLREGARHAFPWRVIDSSKVKANGFVAKQFEFRLDQHKVLDLLTGHTLYNDTRVVIRELVQNSIDAVRLQQLVDGGKSTEPAAVTVRWDEAAGLLEVADNGTGMNQAIINDNFLHVGSSRYQSDEFRNRYPGFSSISRFGIGVLSTFMISDHVQVLTCHPEEQEAREITLESVHGQYLMRLLPKSSHEIPPSIKSHGTIIRLRVRKSAELEDVKRILESWIVVPACPVFYEDGDGAVERVGYTTAVEALESAVAEYLNDQEGSLRQANLAVRSFHRDGLELAYVVKWNPWFREYSLMTRPETDLFSYNSVMSRTRLRRNPRVDEDTRSATGTLIEGVRVTSQSPAMKNSLGMWALANATGQSAPRTNVARTALESGPELDDFAKSVYDGYVDHVKNEVVALQEERGFSLTRAIFEAPFIAAALVEPRVIDSALSGSAYREALRQLPVYALEDEDGRRAASCEDVLALEEFATVDDEIVESVDFLLSSLPRSVTMREMFEFVGLPTTTMPSTPILRLSRQSDQFVDQLTLEAEVTSLKVTDNRSVECHWSAIQDQARWIPDYDRRASGLWSPDRDDSLHFGDSVYAPLTEIAFDGPNSVQHVRVLNQILLVGDHPAFHVEPVSSELPIWARRWFATFLVGSTLARGIAGSPRTDDAVDEYLAALRNVGLLDHFKEGSIGNTIPRISPDVLDPRVSWRAGGPSGVN